LKKQGVMAKRAGGWRGKKTNKWCDRINE
jgi:hypothetical protein